MRRQDVAAAAPGNQDLAAPVGGTLKQHDARAALGRMDGGEEPGGAGAEDGDERR
jgi:hypothetical protein